MAENETAHLPELTPAQEELLYARFKARFALEQVGHPPPTPVEAGGSTAAVVAEDYVFTNATNARLDIPDLGIKSPNGHFRPETFDPFEIKDLRKYYTTRELKASKYLVLSVENGQLIKGKADRAKLEEKNLDPIAKLAKSNPEGTFTDPLSGQGKEFGSRYYDEKMKELIERDRKDDEATRQGA